MNSTSAAAPSGSDIVVYFTGGGPVQGGSALITGHAPPSTVTYLAPGFAGLYQADIQIPTVATGSHNLILSVAGTTSNTTAVSTN